MEALVTQAFPEDVHKVDADLSPDKTVADTDNRAWSYRLSKESVVVRTNALRQQSFSLSLCRMVRRRSSSDDFRASQSGPVPEHRSFRSPP
jgi:hypothetical protein